MKEFTRFYFLFVIFLGLLLMTVTACSDKAPNEVIYGKGSLERNQEKIIELHQEVLKKIQ